MMMVLGCHSSHALFRSVANDTFPNEGKAGAANRDSKLLLSMAIGRSCTKATKAKCHFIGVLS